MTDSPLVSLLSPCYNVEKFLPQCLDSIISQTYSNLQIVLIDDGSKDDTWRVMQDYAGKDNRIEIYHQENQGVAATRNHLLDKVKGDYVLFVDSDDWIEPDMVEFLVGKALTNNIEMVVCGNVINDTPPASEYNEELWSQDKVVKEFLRHVSINGSLWNKLTKVNLLHNVKFHCGISYGEDALFCWELLQNTKSILVTNKQLYHYRMNEISLSHSAFGSKKLSGHKVWTILCEETKRLYPKFIDIAHARFCVETTLLLRDAAHCGYKEIDNVRMLQQTIKQYWHCLNKVNITSSKMKIYAFLACRSYWLASKI